MRIWRKGQLADEHTTADILANDQLLKADDYKPLVVAYRNGAAIQLSDVAEVRDGVANIRTAGFLNGKPSIPGHHPAHPGREHH
jgi:multidrug efflux pump